MDRLCIPHMELGAGDHRENGAAFRVRMAFKSRPEDRESPDSDATLPRRAEIQAQIGTWLSKSR